MYTQEVTINNEVGLHARPATYFIRKANEFKSGIWVEKDERRVNAKSLLGVLSLGIVKGTTITLIADGSDEKEAVEALKAHGMTVTLTKVIAVGIDDKPGAFSKAVRLLSNEGFDVEYMYAFVSKDSGRASVIIRTDEVERGIEVLRAGGVTILSQEDIG